MHKNIIETTLKNHHNTRYMWFTPNVGATSTEMRLYSTVYKHTVLIFALSCRSSQQPKTANLAAEPFFQKPSAHSAAEVVHALSWDLTLLQKPSAHTATEVVHALS